MVWISLWIAGIFEVVWATGLKYSQRFTKPIPIIVTVVGMAISIYFLAVAMKSLPMGTAYAIWTGIGAMGSVIVGIILFNEPANAIRIGFLLCILTGIIGLKITA